MPCYFPFLLRLAGASLNVKYSTFDISGPFLTKTSTVSGPCQTSMLMPVDSLPSANVVGSSCPAKLITLSAKKFSPVTYSVVLSSPIVISVGVIELIDGLGTVTLGGSGNATVCGSLMLAVYGNACGAALGAACSAASAFSVM